MSNTSPENPNTKEPQGRGKRRTLAAIAMALTLTAGAGASAALASADTASSAVEPTTAASVLRSAQTTIDVDRSLADVTLDELAEELERLGLQVRISPAGEHRADVEAGATGEQVVEPFEGMTQDEIEALSDEEFFSRLETAGVDIHDHNGDQDSATESSTDEPSGDEDHDGPPKPLAKVAVDGDTIDTSGLSPEVAEKAQAIWQRFAKLIPADQRRMVSAFELDGLDVGGYVYQEEADPTKWVLGVGTGLGEDLDFVLIHEFGHLLTLQAKEVPPSTDDVSCATFHTGEGCALSGSTIAEFVNKFWPQETRDKINEFLVNGDDAGLAKFRQENSDQFVSDYAATNPGEDLAETFAVFILEDRPAGDSIAAQKVNLLWSDPAMVSLRDQIRSAL